MNCPINEDALRVYNGEKIRNSSSGRLWLLFALGAVTEELRTHEQESDMEGSGFDGGKRRGLRIAQDAITRSIESYDGGYYNRPS